MFDHIRRALGASESADATPALEKMNYNLFVRTSEAFRPALIPGKLADFTTLQLPTFSTLHTINHFLDHTDRSDINPDMHNPLIVNEQWIIYLQHYLTLPTPSTLPFPVAERYTYVANKYKAAAMAFFHHQPKVRRLLSEAAVAKLTNALVVSEYAALNHVRLTGQLSTYRHFDIILRTMLDHVCNSRDNRHHFMQFPVSSRVYTRAQFLKSFSKINTSTIRITNDPSYYLMIHLLGFVYGQSAEADVAYPVVDQALRGASTEPALLTSTSLFARVPEDVLKRLNIILTHANKTIIYNLHDLAEMAEHPSMLLRVLRHINMLKLANSTQDIPDETVDDTAFDDAMVQHQETEVSPEPSPIIVPPPALIPPVVVKLDAPIIPVIVVPPAPILKPTISPVSIPVKLAPLSAVLPPVVKSARQLTFDLHQHVNLHLQTKLATTADQQDVHVTRVEDLQRRHMSVTLAGKPLAEYLQTPLPDIHTNTLDFLDGKIPEATMSTSSIANFDTLYIKDGMHRDLAHALTSLISHGMFVTNIDEIPQVTEFTRRTVYKAALVDLAGKRHSVVFALPQVSATGQMLINGVTSRMTKQQINLPICKISDDRVNLSSNYNKTLLERTATRRHSFSSYFTQYLTLLRTARLVVAQYGSLPNSPVKLPYDYSAIGQTYTRIEGSAGSLVFDYDNRFAGLVPNVAAGERYSESDSTVSHNDDVYSITTLLKETPSLPIRRFKVADLAWVLENNPPDPDRSIDDVYLAKPILVTEWDGKLVVLDGAHRLAKAIGLGLKSMVGRLVPPDMLARHHVATPAFSIATLRTLESKFGVYVGQSTAGQLLFMNQNNTICEVLKDDTNNVGDRNIKILDLLHAWYPDVALPKMVSEWTELKVLDENFPTIFVLGFRFGLTAVLQDANIDTRWVPSEEKVQLQHADLSIPFIDGTLIINRYPLQNSLLIAGLLKFPTVEYYRAEFDSPDVYYRLLMKASISINYLKGITSFFDFFLDPITLDVLHEMGEPTTVRGLLIRANEMLSSYEHHPAASMRNHRLRGYERFSGVLYNEMARQLAAYQGKRQSKKSFSINPEAVFQRVMQDSTISMVDVINPMQEIKDNTALTYAGSGGRTAQSFVIEDRRYPDDAVGIMSEATPDSGKVAMNAYTSADPKLSNLRGMFADATHTSTLTPSNILSSTAMLMPCSVQDD